MADSEPRNDGPRSPRGLSTVERVIFALGLEPRRLQSRIFPCALAQVAARALRAAAPDTISDRERRLLLEAEAIAPINGESGACTDAYALVALVCAGWASAGHRSRDHADAALVACVALTRLIPRERRGSLNERVLAVASLPGLDTGARELARRVTSEDPPSEPELARAFALILDQIRV